MSEWRKIETAPKDGRYLLLWWPFWRHHPIAGHFSTKIGKWDSDVTLYHEGAEPPTHWMTWEPPE